MSDNELLKDYIPKNLTQQKKFLEKYPEYDGRGLVIAILDSIVDVSLDGMHQTTTGLPKVIDCYDFTGAGNVDTSVIRVAENGKIVGLSGRLLKIPSTWKNPSDKWHLGLKPIYELCSEMALENVIITRKEAISKENETLKQKFVDDKMDKEDAANYESFLEYLKSTEDISRDSLVADCIVWFDGEKWHACLDTSFTGDLSNAKVLTDYSDKRDFDIIMDQITYCVKIHNSGNLLEIITLYSAHGTTVAHVAAANYPGEPERNGLAPGTQIISMNINDPLNDNCLNNKALKNALQKCIELKVDIVNGSISLISRDLKELINEMTEKHGIIFVK